MGPTEPPRKRRRWRVALLAILLAGAALFAALPWVLSGSALRGPLKARASAILAPGSVDFAAIRLSWFQPTEIRGFLLRDKRGSSVVVSDRADFSWSLWEILFAQPKVMTLTFPHGLLDVERFEDGRVNLYETLEPILRDKPRREIVVKIDDGRLRFRDKAFAEPVVADKADILLDIAADPGPITWKVALVHTSPAGDPGRFDVSGSFTRPPDDSPGEGDVTLSVKASRWPWTLALAGVEAHGDLEAAIDAGHRSGRLSSTGSATIQNLFANGTGSNHSPGPVGLESVRLSWDVEGDKDQWRARRLELSAPLGAIAASQAVASGESKWLEGDLKVVVDARYAPPADRLTIAGFTVTTPYGRLGGSGTIEAIKATPQLDMKGTLEPDWSLVQARLIREVEPNARIAGRSRAWNLSGTIAKGSGDAKTLDGLRGELGLQLDSLDIFGMRLGSTVLVARAEGGKLTFDPIDATLNEGRLHIEPQWVQEGDGSYRLKFGPSTTLENAVVNDEVSHRVLSFAAPVLDGATRVQGRVSVRRVDAEIPLFASSKEVHARVEGDVLFDEVRFMPGPLADELLSLLPNADQDRPLLVLRDPVSLRIAEGKVHQKGLAFPLARLGAVSLEGSVDFHKNLDMVARFSLNPPQADKPLLATLLKTARLELPIRGTLDDPQIDTQAMQDRLKNVGSDLLENSLGIGAEGILRALQGIAARQQERMADPGAAEAQRPQRPPPLTPEERKGIREERRRERQEKKAERRLMRNQP